MKHYLSILRPLNGVMSAAAVYVGSAVAGAGFSPSFAVMLGMLITFLISGAGMIVNDIRDLNIDKTNRPDRPLPAGKMKARNAWAYCAVLFIIGNALAIAFLSREALYVTLLASSLLLVYNSYLKRVVMAGHLAISFLVGLAFLYGGVIAGNYLPVLPLMLLAFLSNAGREVFKTIEDALGDKKHHVTTITIRYGAHTAKKVASVFIIVAVLLSFVPYVLGILGKSYLAIVLVADVVFVAATVVPMRHASKLTKAAMVAALIAFIVGAYAG